MQYNRDLAQQWLKNTEIHLPHLATSLATVTSEVLIIGASVCEIYQMQDWIPLFQRQTGDIDLSIGIASQSSNDYQHLKRQLISAGYREDSKLQYRLRPPKEIPGAISYVDLLAHPMNSQTSEVQAREEMGAGDGFSFAAMPFARKGAFEIQKQVIFPNPIGFLALKRSSYLDEPMKRIKDLADIAEIVSGLVEKGIHFDIDEIWRPLRDEPYAKEVISMLLALGGGNSTQWDLDDASFELLKRNFTATDVSDLIPRRIMEFADSLG